MEIQEFDLYVVSGLDSSHTHGDGLLHVHVLDLCQCGGVILQVPAVVPADHDYDPRGTPTERSFRVSECLLG